MALKNQYLIDLLETVKKRNAGEPEFIQAVMEVFTSLEPVVERICKILWTAHSRYRCSFLLRQMELDSGTMAMAGRRVLVYVEL